MDKRFWAIIGAIIIIFLGVVVVRNHKSPASSDSTKPTSHIVGKSAANVTFVEYGDFECPVCGVYFQTVEQVQQKYSDQVRFQFRNLPLTQIHKNAFAGARAAEAADLQGKFWQMHDLLYQNQDQSGQSGWVASDSPLDDYFVGYAKQLGLNIDKFKSDYASTVVNDRINADIAAFNKTGQQLATPTFFLDGTYIPNSKLVDSKTGAPSVDAFSQIIDAELAKKTATP
jgi:protein-disulfide isomerase